MRRGKLDSLGVSAFCESMAMMVQSGIQMDEAVALLRSGSGQGGPLEEGLVIMQAETEAGKGLSAAMEATGLFPEYCLRMVLAGEKAGRLEDVLFQLARYYEDQKAMTGKLQSAVLYPVAMLGLIIIVLIVMLAMVLPAFTDVYDSLTGSLTASAYGYVRWAYALCWAALAVMAALAVILALGFALWNAGKRNSVEKILHRIPVCASILDSLGMFRFTAALSTFLASGEIQDIAVAESRKMASYRPVEERIDRCLRKDAPGRGAQRQPGNGAAQTHRTAGGSLYGFGGPSGGHRGSGAVRRPDAGGRIVFAQRHAASDRHDELHGIGPGRTDWIHSLGRWRDVRG